MKNIVYLLEHLHIITEDNEDTKIIGVYSSYIEAQKAVERLKKREGFCDYPDIIDTERDDFLDVSGFYVREYTLDQDQDWTEGFATV